MTDIIEVICREHYKRDDWAGVQRFYPHLIEEFRKNALRFLAEADAVGYVLVPKEPTEEMKRAGGNEGNWDDHHVSSAQYHLMAAQEADDVWRAMIAVSPMIAVRPKPID